MCSMVRSIESLYGVTYASSGAKVAPGQEVEWSATMSNFDVWTDICSAISGAGMLANTLRDVCFLSAFLILF